MSERSGTGQEAASVQLLLEGKPYRFVEFLGRGSMSSVYLVEHRRLFKRFALKMPHPFFAERPDFVDRVRVEAQAIARLEHPNVVEVVDFWIAPGGGPCLVLELLSGRTLGRELAERRTLPAEEAILIATQALSALSAGHDIGIVHRDIKPENLFLHTGRDRSRVLKVLDFGLARVLPEAPASAPSPLNVPTATGALIGSPRFMSPEAARGERVGAAADIFSLGLVLYMMLAGHGPFDRDTAAIPPSRYAGSRFPSDLDAIVVRAIQERPEHRFASAAEFREALERVGRLGPIAPAGRQKI